MKLSKFTEEDLDDTLGLYCLNLTETMKYFTAFIRTSILLIVQKIILDLNSFDSSHRTSMDWYEPSPDGKTVPHSIDQYWTSHHDLLTINNNKDKRNNRQKRPNSCFSLTSDTNRCK